MYWKYWKLIVRSCQDLGGHLRKTFLGWRMETCFHFRGSKVEGANELVHFLDSRELRVGFKDFSIEYYNQD